MIVFVGTYEQAVFYARQKGLNPQKDIVLATRGREGIQGRNEPMELVFCSAHDLTGASRKAAWEAVEYVDHINNLHGHETKRSRTR